ncbi:MAG: sortase [Candidatus Microsaccharimonas sp.]
MDPKNASQGGDSPISPTPQDQQSAAANVIRTQIDSLYGAEQNAQSADDNPYHRTHTEHPQPQADQWKAYHSAWQNYYQQYYEAYYAHQTAQQKAMQQPAAQQVIQNETNNEPQGYFSSHTDLEETTESLSKRQALDDLRQKLLGKVRTRATKIRRSRHFVPIAAALTVVMVFVFLQYNQVLFATVNAYISPGAIDPQNIVVDPTNDNTVGPESRLVIPKINVDAPVFYDISPAYDSQMDAMQKGLAHFSIAGANSHPGEVGNTVISGHSSNDLFDVGDYKFIFAQLEKLSIGDTIYANYNGKRYTYVITKTEVVKPTQVDKLIYPTEKPVMTLITCTPLGTAIDRLLVTAEQVSPDPAAAQAAPAGSGHATSADSDTAIPGASSPTLIERLFGAR